VRQKIDETVFNRFRLDLDTPLFVKVPRPGDSEVTFSVFDLPAYLHTNPFLCWTSSREAV